MQSQIPQPPNDDPAWADAINARREERRWANEDALRGQRTSNDLLALKAIGIATAILIIFFLVVFLASLGVWTWHQVAPCKWMWLSDGQLSNIQSVIFSGAIGAMVASYAQKYLNK